MTTMPVGYEGSTPGVGNPMRGRQTQAMEISPGAAMELNADAALAGKATNPFTLPSYPPGVVPGRPEGGVMALDSALAPAGIGAMYGWAAHGQFAEGVGFLGYPYLAQLAQRSEYRKPVEIIAEHATRKFIELKGGEEEKLTELYAHMDKFSLTAVFREAAEQDGFFGRSHVFLDFGDELDDGEIATPLILSDAKIGKGTLRNIKSVEPMWCYPGGYEATNPLSPSFYDPERWFVMGKEVHKSRFMTMVGREVPDVLKAAYAFGGLSLTQMGKPYVDNWLRTRQSVSDLIHSFSVTALKTDMSTVLQGGCATGVIARAQMFNQFRDNRGLMVLNNETEDLVNVSTPLSTLDALQAQAQEQMASVFGIPLIILLRITPGGLNASSDGEIRAFYADVNAYQERVFRKPLRHILRVLQIDLWGKIDPDIEFVFPDLWDMDEKERAEINKIKADTDAVYLDSGVVSQEEARERLAEDYDGNYTSVDLSGEPPELPETDFVTDTEGDVTDGNEGEE